MADASVRPARSSEADQIARIQRDTLAMAYESVMPAEILAQIVDPGVQSAILDTITAEISSNDPSAQVLVALEGDQIVGFAFVQAAVRGGQSMLENGDPDPEPHRLPRADAGRAQMGPARPRIRLLSAATEFFVNAGFTRAITWVPESNAATTPSSSRPAGPATATPAASRPRRARSCARSDCTPAYELGSDRDRALHRDSAGRAGLLRGSGGRQQPHVLVGAQGHLRHRGEASDGVADRATVPGVRRGQDVPAVQRRQVCPRQDALQDPAGRGPGLVRGSARCTSTSVPPGCSSAAAPGRWPRTNSTASAPRSPRTSADVL